MKRKTAAILTGIVLSFSVVAAGCSSTNTQTTTEDTSEEVTVDSYSTTVTTSDVNEESTTYIDRSAFDTYYGTSTELSTNG